MLEKLSTIKIGVVLVELVQVNILDSNSTKDEALEMLTSLIQTIISSVQVDHPVEVTSHAIIAVSACIEEFVSSVPIPVLDEILIHVGNGPVTLVTNPEAVEYDARLAEAKKKRKTLPKERVPPAQIQQRNQSYVVAASIIKRTEDRIAGPISSLLNGLLNSLPDIMEKTAIAPAAESSNSGPDVYAIVYELHRIAPPILTTIIGSVSSNLLITNIDTRSLSVKLLGRLFYSKTGDIAVTYMACYREWLRRSKDVDTKIRSILVQCLVMILSNRKTKEVRDLATNCLTEIVSTDPDANVRIDAIHKLCDLAYEDKTVMAPDLIRAVGGRIASKNKNERKDAATGLARCYFKHYCTSACDEIERGGEDVDISIILNALEEKDISYKSPNFYDDSHVKAQFEWIPIEILKAACFSDQIDFEMRNRIIQILDDVFFGPPGKLSSTSKAVALSIFMDSLKGTDAEKWLSVLLHQRATLQSSLERYIKARSSMLSCKPKTEEYFTFNATAMEHLERLISFCALNTGNSRKTISEEIHSHKDKHVFRILSTISSSRHSSSARARAFNDLPARTKNLSESSSTWIKTLTRRCAMGNSINEEVIAHCILLAQECFAEEEYRKADLLLAPVEFVSKIFPDLIVDGAFTNLTELFGEVYETTLKKKKDDLQKTLTCLSAILSKCAPTVGRINEGEKKNQKSPFIDFQNNLIRICTRDGLPEQSRASVEILFSLKQLDVEKLFKQLTSPQKLRINNNHILSILSALSVVAEKDPNFFQSERGRKVIKFALEDVLLGKASNENESNANMIKEDQSKETRKKSKKRLRKEDISFGIQRILASIDFLVTHIRACIKWSKAHKINLLSNDHIDAVFNVLFQIVEDKGVPPSTRDATDSDVARAALRECAAINILRLCDPCLQLTDSHIKPQMWQALSSCFLDSDKFVREHIIHELGQMLTGQGKYCHGKAYAPSLRFLALVSMCIDSEGNTLAYNADAATVGKVSQSIKQSAFKCIQFLRKTSESTLAQCRALGSGAEANFERKYKFVLMPEFSVPYCLHMLCFRHETPHDDKDDTTVLKKRLKWLLEPMVGSLGESADNISFLLRMTELIGSKYVPFSDNAEADSKRVKIVCDSATDVLLKFVKKDINLTVYPGQIQIPSTLFRPKRKISKQNQSVKASQTSFVKSSNLGQTSKPNMEKSDSPNTPLDDSAFGDISPIRHTEQESFMSPPTSILRPSRFSSSSIHTKNKIGNTKATGKTLKAKEEECITPPDDIENVDEEVQGLNHATDDILTYEPSFEQDRIAESETKKNFNEDSAKITVESEMDHTLNTKLNDDLKSEQRHRRQLEKKKKISLPNTNVNTPLRERRSKRLMKPPISNKNEESKEDRFGTPNDSSSSNHSTGDSTLKSSRSQKLQVQELENKKRKRRTMEKHKPITVKVNRPDSLSASGSKASKSPPGNNPAPQSYMSRKRNRTTRQAKKIDEFDFEGDINLLSPMKSKRKETKLSKKRKSKTAPKSSKKNEKNSEKTVPQKRKSARLKH